MRDKDVREIICTWLAMMPIPESKENWQEKDDSFMEDQKRILDYAIRTYMECCDDCQRNNGSQASIEQSVSPVSGRPGTDQETGS